MPNAHLDCCLSAIHCHCCDWECGQEVDYELSLNRTVFHNQDERSSEYVINPLRREPGLDAIVAHGW